MAVQPEVRPEATTTAPPRTGVEGTVPLPALLDAWVAQQLLTPAQAQKLRDADLRVAIERPPGAAHRPRAVSVAVEAVGYLGGILVLSAAFSLAAMYWGELETWHRLLALGGAAAALFVAGAALRPERTRDDAIPGPTARLRSVLWTGTVAATAGFLAVVGVDSLDWRGPSIFVLISSGAAVVAAGLWWWDRSLLLQLALMVTTVLVPAAVVLRLTEDGQLPGFAAWVAAAIWFVLARSRRDLDGRLLSTGAGLAAVVAAMTTFPTDRGIVLALATAVAMITVAARGHDLVLLVFGSLALLQMLPMAITTWFPDTAAVPVVLLIGGGLVVVGAVWTARRSQSSRGQSSRTRSP